MSDTSELLPPVRASTRRSRRIPVIWIIPIIAIAIGGWLAWDTLSKRVPLSPSPSTARKAAGRPVAAQVQRHNAGHGEEPESVPGPHSRGDGRHDPTSRSIAHRSDSLLGRQTEPVRGNVSGLDTLLSGSYIGMMPGATEGKPQRAFTGREEPPILQANIPGTPSPEGEPARFDLPRLAGILPRSQRGRGARLGHRRHGHKRHHPHLRSCAVRQIRHDKPGSGTRRVSR